MDINFPAGTECHCRRRAATQRGLQDKLFLPRVKPEQCPWKDIPHIEGAFLRLLQQALG